MDYYEELGINRTATEEEIRRAHRRLTKLLHPDQQTDDAVKQLAETQMRRVNSIVDVLCDPERRRAYDEELKDGPAVFQAGRAKRGAFHSWPWWIASTVGAVVLTVAAVWFWADKWGSSFGGRSPTYIGSGAETGAEPNPSASRTESPSQPSPQTQVPSDAAQAAKVPAPLGQPVPLLRSEARPAASRTVASVPASPATANAAHGNNRAAQSKTPQQTKPAVVVADLPRHKKLNLPLTAISARPTPARMELPSAPALSTAGLTRVEAASLPAGTLPSAPKLAEPITPVSASYNKTSDPLEGEWVYAPSEPEKRKAGFYPPEFIDLKIWNRSGLHGEYHARYRVTDKPIPADVTFALAPGGNPRHFTWESGNGSKGTLKVSSMDASSIRIEWKTTVFSPAPSLTAGTATLVRRTP